MSFHQQLMVHVSQYVKQISTKICQKIVTNTKPHQSHRGALRRNGKIVLVTPGHRVVVQKRWDAVLRWFYDTEIQPSTPSGMHKSCKSWDKPTITVTAGFQASSLDDVNSQQVQLHSHKPSGCPERISDHDNMIHMILICNPDNEDETPQNLSLHVHKPCYHVTFAGKICASLDLSPIKTWIHMLFDALYPLLCLSMLLKFWDQSFLSDMHLAHKMLPKKNLISWSSLSVVDTILNNNFYILVFDLLCTWLLGFRWPSCKWFLSTPGGTFRCWQLPFLPVGKSSTKL